ncbi:MAG TPA: DNA polymerase I, partial [Sedimentisphaerales bacterium]|nr:DNA polymerase I [Sedimentisphaerales bacterium]
DTAAACEYSAEDADITWQLFEALSRRLEHEPRLGKLFEQVEMPLVTVLASMEMAGVSIDAMVLRKLSAQITNDLEKAAERIYEKAGVKFNIDSPKQLAEVLFDRLGLASLKEGKTGRSTDADVLEQLAEANPIVRDILEYRQLGKLKNTYVDKLPGLVNPRTGRLHAAFNQTVTTTGRLSSSDPNLQNIPIRTPLGRKIRSAFVPARKDWCILSADYSQIELRMLAHFSKDPAMVEAFTHDRDIHRFVASQVYNVPIDKVTDEQRSRCKTVNFGIIYGQGPFGLSKTTGMSQQEARKFIDDYFRRYSAIRAFMDKTIEEAGSKGYAETILHRRRTITGLDARNFNIRSQAERLAFNTVLQGSAADLIKVAMVNIQRRIEEKRLPVKMILQIHDELVFELHADEAETHGRWIAQEMAGAIKLDVPLKVDVSSGTSWMG